MATRHDHKRSTAATVVQVLAWVGVGFWIWMVVKRIIDGWPEGSIVVVLLAIVLGGSHVLISRFTTLRSNVAIWLTWWVLIADLGLTFFVNLKALVLVGASVVILIAGYRARRDDIVVEGGVR